MVVVDEARLVMILDDDDDSVDDSVDDSTDASVDVATSVLVDSSSEDVVDDATEAQIVVFGAQQIAGQVLKQLPSIPSSRIASHSNNPIGNEGKSPERRLWLR